MESATRATRTGHDGNDLVLPPDSEITHLVDIISGAKICGRALPWEFLKARDVGFEGIAPAILSFNPILKAGVCQQCKDTQVHPSIARSSWILSRDCRSNLQRENLLELAILHDDYLTGPIPDD
jgi:hypothetical protein